MKYNSFFKILLFGFICAFMATSCVKEGPMGPAGSNGADGSDGKDGVDGQVTCLQCHSGTNMDALNAGCPNANGNGSEWVHTVEFCIE